jgi:predicted DNA binding CopG/RHH family protein
MRQSVPAKESSTESFSGVLEKMAHATLANDRGTGIVATATRRQQVRPLPDLKSRVAAEAVSLSYEQALKRHSRRGIPDDSDLPDALSLGQNSSARSPQNQIPKAAPKTSEARSIPQTPSRIASRRMESGANASTGKGRNIEKTRPSIGMHTSRVATQNLNKTAKAAAPKELAQTRSKTGPKPRHVSKPNPSRLPQELSSAAGEALRLRKAFVEGQTNLKKETNIESGRHTLSGTTTRAITRIASPTIDSFAKPAFDPATAAIDQRRTIISVRLSEEESNRLRLRAAESGISVSAYMRSCVLDADHLRNQVKQALNQMRAGIQHPELVTAMQLSAQSGAVNGGTWLRVITRTAALFLTPLFSLRHRG